MIWKYSNPVKIIFTELFNREIKKNVENSGKILVVCSERFQKTKSFLSIKKSLRDFQVFSEIEHNPSLKSCQKALTFVKKLQPNVIIAIGGGSIIDTAKIMRMSIYKSCYDIQRIFNNLKKRNKNPLFIAIPTTYGTGSELTMWATLWDKINKRKYSVSECTNYPDYAIYDVNLVESLPTSIAISSTLDALSHAFESLWNKNSNLISDTFSLQAIKLIYDNLDKIVKPMTIDIRKNLLIASMYAGLAFSNTKTAAAHSISYPLSLHFDIPHGIACSMPLYPLCAINGELIQIKLANLLTIIQLRDMNQFWDAIFSFVKNEVPFKLREYGVKKKDLNWLRDLCFTKGRMENNIRNLDKTDVLRILNEIY